MALSDHEQRLLDEMERNLYQHDAEFVASVQSIRPRPSYRNIVWGVLLSVAGLGIVIGAVIVHLVIVGVLGFAAIVAGVMIAIRTTPQTAGAQTNGTAKPAKARQSFMDRVNDRWEKRQGS